MNAPGFRSDRISRSELTEQAGRFFSLFRAGVASGETDLQSEAWSGAREMLDSLSGSRARQGFSPSETAIFIFSLKEPLFERLRERLTQTDRQAPAIIEANALLDRLGLYTTESFQRGREQVILRQQQELMELSTPVVTLWEGVLGLPVIGTLDSARTQVVMETCSSASSTPAPPSPSSISPASPPSTRSPRSTC